MTVRIFRHFIAVSSLCAVLLATTACGRRIAPPKPIMPPKPGVESFFSEDGAAKDAILREIGGAQREIGFAVYQISDPSIIAALREARARGLDVHGVVDSSCATRNAAQIQDLLAAGVDVKVPASGGLMHHKFAVFDQVRVLTGSYNWTVSASANHENVIVVKDKALAATYVDELAVLAALAKPATDSAVEAKKTTDLVVERFLSDGNRARDAVVREICNAKRNIRFALAVVGNEDIAVALLKAKERGLDVLGVTGIKKGKMPGGWNLQLAANGLVDALLEEEKLGDARFAVIDEVTVLTGTYSWAETASRGEVLGVIRDEKIGCKYLAKWRELVATSRVDVERAIKSDRTDVQTVIPDSASVSDIEDLVRDLKPK